MYTARIVVLIIALSAGGLAAYLASSASDKPAAGPQQPVAQIQTVDVLVAKNEIQLGQVAKTEDMEWQTWPASAASGSFITRRDRPDAVKEIAGSIARSPFVAGEPIREQKLVKAQGSGYMAAILPSGMRAVSTEISAESGAGGFILPNDRVDVVLTRHDKNLQHPGAADLVVAQVIFSNVRVLAIDQAPKEKEGQTTLVGRTATLELKPEQIPILAASQKAGTLSLALRSITDAKAESESISNEQSQSAGVSLEVIRYGVANQVTVKK